VSDTKKLFLAELGEVSSLIIERWMVAQQVERIRDRFKGSRLPVEISREKREVPCSSSSDSSHKRSDGSYRLPRGEMAFKGFCVAAWTMPDYSGLPTE
jgi:hypothetical protein